MPAACDRSVSEVNGAMNRRVTVIRIGMLAGLCLAVLPPATAAAGPCAADVQKLCAGVQPGGGRIRDCIRQHESELSEACKKNIQEKGQQMEEAWKACKPDVEKLCKDVAPGGGRVAACLKTHEKAVSPACKQEVAKVSEKKK